MRTWFATVIVQTKAKSYPVEYKCRVVASSPHVAANKATAQTFRANARQLKRRSIESVTIRMINLGEADKPETETAVESPAPKEAA